MFQIHIQAVVTANFYDFSYYFNNRSMCFLNNSDLHNIWDRDTFFPFTTLFSSLKKIIKQLTCIKSADCRHFRYWLFTFCRNYRNIYTLMLEHDNVSDTSMKYLYQSIHVHNLKSHMYDCLLSLISPVFIFKELLCWCGCMLVNTDIPNS